MEIIDAAYGVGGRRDAECKLELSRAELGAAVGTECAKSLHQIFDDAGGRVNSIRLRRVAVHGHSVPSRSPDCFDHASCAEHGSGVRRWQTGVLDRAWPRSPGPSGWISYDTQRHCRTRGDGNGERRSLQPLLSPASG
jgi:hypothetical protein